MININRKILNLSLVASIFVSSTLQAGGIANVLGGQEADYGTYGAGFVGQVGSTAGGSINYAVGGKYKFVIDRHTPKPWFNIQPPEASLGCGGFSLKGMFGSLLNLDQIGEQLKDAGAAFAWGLILGLVTSLPSIKEVFDTINRWASQIQGLLANACNIGKKISSGSAVNKGIDDAASGMYSWFSDVGVIKDIQKTTGEGAKAISEGLDAATDWANNGTSENGKYDIIFKILTDAMNNPSGLSASFQVYVKQHNAPIHTFLSGATTLTDAETKTHIYDVGTLQYKTNPTGLSAAEIGGYQFKMVSSIIASNLIGLSGMTTNHWTTLKTTYTYLTKIITGLENDKKKTADAINTFSRSIPNHNEAKAGTNGKLTVTEFAEWMEKGTYPTGKLYTQKLVGVSSNAHSTGQPRLFISEVFEHQEMLIEAGAWGAVVSKFGNVSEISRRQIDCVTKNSAAVANCSTLPAVTIPSMVRYMKIYSQANQSDQRELYEILVNLNTIMWYDAFLNEVENAAGALASQGIGGGGLSSAPGGTSAAAVNAKALPSGFNQKESRERLAEVQLKIKEIREKLVKTNGIDEAKAQADRLVKNLKENIHSEAAAGKH